MKVRVVAQPTGLLNGQPWPEVGEEVELDDAVAEGMVKAGGVEVVKDKPKKADHKPVEKVEKATASKVNVETRKK